MELLKERGCQMQDSVTEKVMDHLKCIERLLIQGKTEGEPSVHNLSLLGDSYGLRDNLRHDGKSKAIEGLRKGDLDEPYRGSVRRSQASIGSSIAWEASAKEIDQSDGEDDLMQVTHSKITRDSLKGTPKIREVRSPQVMPSGGYFSTNPLSQKDRMLNRDLFILEIPQSFKIDGESFRGEQGSAQKQRARTKR